MEDNTEVAAVILWNSKCEVVPAFDCNLLIATTDDSIRILLSIENSADLYLVYSNSVVVTIRKYVYSKW